MKTETLKKYNEAAAFFAEKQIYDAQIIASEPELLNFGLDVCQEITKNPSAFETRVRDYAYDLAMSRADLEL